MNPAILSIVIGCCAAVGSADDEPPSALAAIPSRTDVDEILDGLYSGGGITDAERKLVVQSIRSERTQLSLWSTLNSIHVLKKSPGEFIDAVETLFRTTPDDEKRPFVKFKSAAILMKFRPDFAPSRQWVEPQLESESKVLRTLAAATLGSAGPSARDVVPKLKKLLDDKSAGVRVMAARSMFLITGDADAVLEPLLASLSAEPESVQLRPFSSSVSSGDHRHIAAATLGTFRNRSEKAALGLCRLLDDEDAGLRYIAFQSLRSLDCQSDAVLGILRRLQQDTRPSVVYQATTTLELFSKD